MKSARAAYEAWRAAHTHPTVPWEKLKPRTKSVWLAVANAAIANSK